MPYRSCGTPCRPRTAQARHGSHHQGDSLGITVKDSLSQGLVVWAVNAYSPSRDWEGLVQELADIRPGIPETAFDDENAKRLDDELQDLHVRILEGLRARITRGKLRKSDWRGLYEAPLPSSISRCGTSSVRPG